MIYQINYRPIFSKAGKFNGYEISTNLGKTNKKEDFLQITIDSEKIGEYHRIRKMLQSTDPFSDDIFIIDAHPMDVVSFVRGETVTKRPIHCDDNGWVKDLDVWKVNMRGERV